jgi:hypothetical protein
MLAAERDTTLNAMAIEAFRSTSETWQLRLLYTLQCLQLNAMAIEAFRSTSETRQLRLLYTLQCLQGIIGN